MSTFEQTERLERALMDHTLLERKGIQMTAVVSSMAIPPGARVVESGSFTGQAYRAKKSLTSIQFNGAGKGRFVFLPEGSMLHVVAPSSLRGCVEVTFERQSCHIFKADLRSKASLIFEPIRPKGCALEPCA
jgi:hypothetical protein